MSNDADDATCVWLALIEKEAAAHWPPELDRQELKVSMTRGSTVDGFNWAIPRRVSPLFPLTGEFQLPDASEPRFFIGFACFDPAFPVLARLSNASSPDLRRGLAASLGLASVVAWSYSDTIIDAIIGAAGEQPRATELWEVSKSCLVRTTCQAPEPVDPGDLLVGFPSYASLPVPARAAVDEFLSAIGLIVPKVLLHVPSELTTFEQLVGKARDLVSEMVYCVAPKGEPPSTLTEYREEDFQDDGSLAEIVLHQAWDRLIQINSALSYLPTQALSGAIPILERRSLIRRNSLLGVGTATLALTRLTRSIEQAFAVGALEDGLGRYGDIAKPLPGLESLPEYDARNWHDHSVNTWSEKLAPREPYLKLPYFSGRLGFRETEYTISAALQALTAGADPEWSFLTLTHELVHGHVRNLLALIFQGVPDMPPNEKWHKWYERFEGWLQSDGSRPNDLTFVDSVRHVLLSYCCNAQSHGSLAREPEAMPGGPSGPDHRKYFLPTQEALWQLLAREYRTISEVLVHVLDLNYFYASYHGAYIPLIWRSWAPLPQVRADLRQYLLRSLLVVATKSSGSALERFDRDCAHLDELLAPAESGAHRGAAVIREARDWLQREERHVALFYPYACGLILTDLANSVLTSTAVRGAVLGRDPLIGAGDSPGDYEDWREYDLDPGFVDTRILSPAAYLADRVLRRARNGGGTLEADTLELFLACASYPDEERRDE